MTLDAVDFNIYFFFSFFAATNLFSLDALTTVSLLNGCAREKSSLTLASIPELCLVCLHCLHINS